MNGSTELRDLPAGWRWVQLGEVCDKITDGTHHSPTNGPSGQFKYVTAKNIKPWGLDLTDITYVEEDVHREIYSRCDVRKDDVLFVKDGATTGRVTVNHLDEEFSLLSSVGVLRPGKELLPKYLMYALQEPSVKDNMLANVAGVAITRLTLTKLKASAIPLAPIEQQRHIVAEIEKQFSRLDEAIANLKRVKVNLIRYKAAVLKAAVEGKLTKEWRRGHPDVEPASKLLDLILAKRQAKWEEAELAKMEAKGKVPKDDKWKRKYKGPVPPDMTDLPELPKGWQWSNFESASERVTVGHVGSMKDEYVEEGVPFLRSQNVRPNHYDAKGLKFISQRFHERLEKSALSPGDIVVVRSGSVGVSCVIPDNLLAANCSDLVIIKSPRAVLPAYGAYYINSVVETLVAAGKVGVALTHFNTQSVAQLAVPVPPMSEQVRVVDEVDRRFSLVRETGEQVEANFKRAERLRQAILVNSFVTNNKGLSYNSG